MKCLKCGYSIPEDSEFCQYCGSKLEINQSNEDYLQEEFSVTKSIENEDKIPKTKKSSNMKTIYAHVANNEASTPLEIVQTTNEKTSKPTSFKGIALIAIAIAIISLIINSVQYNSNLKITSDMESLKAQIEEMGTLKEQLSEQKTLNNNKEKIIKDLRQKNSQLEAQNYTQSQKLSNAELELFYYHDCVALVNNFYGNCAYHTMICDKLNTNNFYLKTIHAAEDDGCWPCPDCFKSK